MMDWARRNPLPALLAAAAFVLALVIAAEALLGARAPASPSAPARAAPSEAKLLPPVALASAEQAYPETTARPIFSPGRRPAPEGASAAQNAFQKGQFVLQGVIAVGDNRVAMLREKTSGRIHRVAAGGDVNGIKVAKIDPEEVTLAMGNDQEVLPLLVGKAATGMPGANPSGSGATGPFVPAPESNQAPANPSQAHPAPAPGQPFVPPTPSQPQGGGNPLGRPPAAQGSNVLSPEELLARRRARRATPAQPQ